MNRLTDDRTAKALKDIIDKLKEGGFEVDVSNERYVRLAEYEQRDWISVEDRLPNDCERVLVFTEQENIIEGAIFPTVNKSDYPYWLSTIGNKPIETEYGKVTHWRYLPETPKEVKDNV